MKNVILGIVCTLVAVACTFEASYLGFKEGWRQADQSCPTVSRPERQTTLPAF
jgi:hypothetical protein